MSTAFVTTSYAPDFDRFARLHDSVVQYSDLMHYAFVPRADVDLFAPLTRSGRLRLTSTREVLSSTIVTTEWLNRTVARLPGLPSAVQIAAVNVRRPWPPMRGWILQQLVKLAAAEHVDADTLVFVDSETQLIRPVTETTFRRGGCTRLFRLPEGVHEGMARHRAWHRRAHRLLALDPFDDPPYDDFIGGITSWDTTLVRDCTDRVAQVAGRPWQTVIGRCLDISEYTLYGEYVMNLASPAQRAFQSDRPLCHVYWQREPLNRRSAREFVDSLADDDIAIHVQSNAHTPPEIERYVHDAVREATR
ncbi:DUF6492 family protein [Ornithinimicrobium kibberense]|uniref:DUF6492 family protein n=1 Tax=Ornithinimicrobium kibberense TaxID=282060 RepID=A0ABV5V6C8_9MICO|nr:DUF6492 family protein [Ornithinimicrobium kibberense]